MFWISFLSFFPPFYTLKVCKAILSKTNFTHLQSKHLALKTANEFLYVMKKRKDKMFEYIRLYYC